ncbi:MAG: adenylate/guanylate cyclase domain-containing protein [Methylophilaceae bacterium 17-43-7]|jgi:guanylate cyclase|nr:MAG: adenylate/guanylate cyclase domain-containing protein [Methylophilales bacterium 28-44-11]OYZ69593.1 MAG: adenylate/guanylate cyclase domain-containing protein [Methylophilaceae bacterium 17-43-7]
MNSHLQRYFTVSRQTLKGTVERNFVTQSDETLGKTILSMLVLAESAVSIFWIFTISGLGEGYALMAITPYVYLIFSYVSLFVFYRTQRYHYFIFTQLVMLLVMPFFLQWTIGGYQAAGGVAIWAILSPIGALMILGTRKSVSWFVLFVALAAFSWVFNDLFSGNLMPMPARIKDTFLLMNIIGTACILYAAMSYFQSQKERTLSALADEQARSDKLLLNILPSSIAQRLKNQDMRIADSHPSVTILFADIVGFTELSTSMAPFDLVNLLSGIFSMFDYLAEGHKLEKIKTIGDGYLVAGGVPLYLEDHAKVVVALAIEMRSALETFNQKTGHHLHMRIGMCSGPVVAGVIGTSKFAYDIWGDTVNMASRMEQTGIEDEIQVSESTYQMLKDHYRFECRKDVQIKGKGLVNTYLLKEKIA